MVQSVELVLDADLDRVVRDEWALLLGADLPSQARHTGASNAPHVTIAETDCLDPSAEEALSALARPVGLELRLGGFLVFPGRTAVLARAVVPSAALLAAHAAIHAVVPGPDHLAPGRWTPHVTLARRLGAADLAAALELLGDRPRELTGSVRAVRRWDGDARATWDLA